ncbi:hypothetical protein ScPMuIL_011400 [Solemya velum]
METSKKSGAQLFEMKKKQKLQEARQYIKTLDQKMCKKMNEVQRSKPYHSRRNTVMSGIGNSVMVPQKMASGAGKSRLQLSASESVFKDTKSTTSNKRANPLSKIGRAISEFSERNKKE